jgi:PBSX family phage terminase large subunit
MEVEISLLPVQIQFMKSTKDITMLICGRGFGKTFITSLKIAVLLAEGHSVIAMAQNFRAVKHALFPSILKALDSLHQKYEVNISDFTIKVGKATCYGFSSQNYESCRGLDSIKALVIDEACLAPRAAYDVASACLRGAGRPEIYLSSTPRGAMNWVTKLKNDDNVTYLTATTYDNTFLDQSFVKLLESQYDERFVKQELNGEILDSDDNSQMFKTKILDDALGTNQSEDKNWKICLGIDCAGAEGEDSTCIVVRKGKNILEIVKDPHADSMQKYRMVERLEQKYGIDKISSYAIDMTGGYGESLFDKLKTTRKNVIPVQFAATSPNEHCFKYRTYMYNIANDYFANGGHIGDNFELYEELIAQEYFLNKDGKKQLIPKAIIKQKISRSPDISDAFVLSLMTKGDMFLVEDKFIREIKNDAFRFKFNTIGSRAGFKND